MFMMKSSGGHLSHKNECFNLCNVDDDDFILVVVVYVVCVCDVEIKRKRERGKVCGGRY